MGRRLMLLLIGSNGSARPDFVLSHFTLAAVLSLSFD
jgi:hypothetical protein